MSNPKIAEYGKNTRFPINRQNHTKKGKYLVPLLRRFLEKRINYQDPETSKIIKGKVKDAVIWRLLLNATQGENEAIKEILNRIDGKIDTNGKNGRQIQNIIYNTIKVEVNDKPQVSPTHQARNRIPVNEPV